MEGHTVLICDDEPTLRELMRVALGSDYCFAEASSAAEAIGLARRLRPDLLLLDVMMPGGSGFDVLAALRADPELSETPAVIVSAFSTESDRCAALAAGADRFVGKPFDPTRLAAVAEELLAGRRPRRERGSTGPRS